MTDVLVVKRHHMEVLEDEDTTRDLITGERKNVSDFMLDDGITRVVDGRHYKRTANGQWREVTKDFGDWFRKTSKRPEGIVSEMWKTIRKKDRVRAGRALRRMNEIVGKNLGMIEEAEEERTTQQIKHGRGPRLMKTSRARRTRELTHEQVQ